MSRSIFGVIIITIFFALMILFKLNSMAKDSQNYIEPDLMSNGAKPGTEPKDSKFSEKDRNRISGFQAGINLLIYGHPNIKDGPIMFRHLKELGVNSIAIAFPFYQADWQADQVEESPSITPTKQELEGIIKEAHAEGLYVMLRPILDEKSLAESGYWRGKIEPTDPMAWFDSYSSLLSSYAVLAEENNVEVLNIGTELSSLQGLHSAQWLKLIEKVKSVYKGKLIYSFNWDTVNDIANIEFVDLLDYVGIDAYFPLDSPDGASAAELERDWRKWTGHLENTLRNKSIIITEAGIIPVAGAYRYPYMWSIPGGKLDWMAQANYYDATFRAWRPLIDGIYWWSVVLAPNPVVIDYSPLGSPAELVIKQHFLSERVDSSH